MTADKIGAFGIDGGSSWFHGDLEDFVEREEVRPVREHLKCTEGCGGEMKFTGSTWSTFQPGYHHTCDKCGETVAIEGKQFPRISYEPIP